MVVSFMNSMTLMNGCEVLNYCEVWDHLPAPTLLPSRFRTRATVPPSQDKNTLPEQFHPPDSEQKQLFRPFLGFILSLPGG